ncbi:MAG: type I DNA topoisomerase [Microscillaceae bacterium]|nr:type I DNA topoisomerase [Microscillaceae bacterium]MDW8461640.1 type I DNA topoisomerase [Cytophagales bacterium]
MSKNLVIVESPAKAKTIESYLGKDFIVKSSFGHVRDLPKNDKAIDIQNGFKPTYEISEDKKEIVNDLKKLANQAEVIWLASDDDREGEAISWHLKEALNLEDAKTRRIVFREITKNAILNAIQNPRSINENLVNAQQARRILDRLVGFEISPILWAKIKTGLSAGRVQSVAVRLIVEREREISNFKPQSSYKVVALFQLDKDKILKAELAQKIPTQEQAQTFLEKCIGAEFYIQNLEVKPAKKSPAPPFTTSTLQQEASRKLRFSVAQTMILAQKLYEAGKISYMRTDSTNLSEEAISNAAHEIKRQFGQAFVQTRQYKTKNETAQEAHEAIRPTDFSSLQVSNDRNEQRLYELIWKRAIASQMADAQLERTIVTIAINPVAYNQKNNTNETMPTLTATGEIIKFEGFLKVYLESTDDEEDEKKEQENMLPPLQINQKLPLKEMLATETFTRHPPRYTEASLVKQLEEMGIGRPSTYAPIISTIQQRGYVVKEDREGKERIYQEIVLKDNTITQTQKKEITGAEKAKLFPTDMAGLVNDFLLEHFKDIVDYSFTAQIEKEFDEIAQGKKEWVKMLENFYKHFHQKVEESKQVEKSSIGNSRILGIHPTQGKEVQVIIGRYGAFVQIGNAEDNKENPQRASLQKGQRFETITLEEALALFQLPRIVGSYEGKDMKVAIGKFGPYIQHDNKFYSLGKEDNPYSITEERAIEIIEQKRKQDAEKVIKTFPERPDISILNGRYGAYIKVGNANVKIPKEKLANPQTLSLQDCLEIIEQKITTSPKSKATAKTKTTQNKEKRTTKKKKS